MTDPQSGIADTPSESDKETAAVRRDTGTASDPVDAEIMTTDTDTGKAGDVPDPLETVASDTVADKTSGSGERVKAMRRIEWSRAVVFVVLPALALLLAIAAGFLKWQGTSARNSQIAGIEAVAAAKDATIALLSYKPDSAAKDLDAARDKLTGSFKESYTQLIHDVVIPGAKDKHIASVATVPAAASVSATSNHAVVVLFVNQTTIIGNDAPTDSQSSVRVTLVKTDGRWLISGFDPV